MKITEKHKHQIIEWANKYSPNPDSGEIGGFVFPSTISLEPNCHPNPTHFFGVRTWNVPGAIAFWHTHPGWNFNCLSSVDIEISNEISLPFIMYSPQHKNFECHDPIGTLDYSVLSSQSKVQSRPDRSFQKAKSAVRKAEEKMRRSDEWAIAQLRQIATQTKNARAQAWLAGQIAEISTNYRIPTNTNNWS